MTVGVYVVTRNRREVLTRCLGSIGGQTRAPAEVVLIDNDSSDDTVELVRSMFPDVRVIEVGENLGCPGGRNLAAQSASADVLFFVDDDSTLAPDAVERAQDAARGDDRIGVFAPRIIEQHGGRRWALLDGPPRDLPRFIGQCLIRRKAMLESGLFPAHILNYGEEQGLALALFERGYRIVYEPSIVVYHFPESVQRDANREMALKVQSSASVKWRFLPYAYAIGGTSRTLVILLVEAFRTRTIRGYLRGLAGLPRVVLESLRNRRPVSQTAWRRYLDLRGAEGSAVLLDDESG